MKKLTAIFALAIAVWGFNILDVMAITPSDYSIVLKTLKKIDKIGKNYDVEKIGQYYSDNYKSFDGYGKKELLQIFELSRRLYPNVKANHKVTKIETKNEEIKVYITEKATANMDADGVDARYAVNNKIKGIMNTYSDFAVIFKKEDDGIWRIIRDENYFERTDIKYGEAINAPFEIEAPDNIFAGEEFSVKTTIEPPKDRVVVGSIGHDEIVFPPVKSSDPYRPIGNSGILERIMMANKEGKNEYINASYAYIIPSQSYTLNNEEIVTKPAISGLGLVVTRVNALGGACENKE